MGNKSKFVPPRQGERQVKLHLPYTSRMLETRTVEMKDGSQQIVVGSLEPGLLTRRLLEFAVNTNGGQGGQDPKDRKMWSRILDRLDEAEEKKATQVILSPEQFDFLYAEVEKCRYPAVSAQSVTILTEHLEEVKMRKDGQPE